jgi:hypothetical protein
MIIDIYEDSFIAGGVSYPFNKPETFDLLSKAEQLAFVSGVLHALSGANNKENDGVYMPQNPQTLEVLV